MLRDSAVLPFRDVRAADGVQELRLAVVDVPHDRDDGRPGPRSSSFSFSSSITVSSYRDTTLTLQSYSAARRDAVSESICWLIVTIIPMPMSLWMRSEPLRFIFGRGLKP